MANKSSSLAVVRFTKGSTAICAAGAVSGPDRRLPPSSSAVSGGKSARKPLRFLVSLSADIDNP
jgi:hypothetical protein